ncbi:hypothetical protein BH11ARM2_BH11ARM2_27030 [soil metagenome]
MENPNYVQYPRFQERRVRFEALSEAFTWFGRDAKLYMVAALPALLVTLANLGVSIPSQVATFQTGRQPVPEFALILQAINLVAAIVQYVTLAAVIRVAVRRLDGRVATPFSGFEGFPWLSIIGASIIIGLLTLLGSCFCLLPGLMAAGLLMVTYPLITEQKLGASMPSEGASTL